MWQNLFPCYISRDYEDPKALEVAPSLVSLDGPNRLITIKATHKMAGANYMGGRRYKSVHQASKDLLIMPFKGIWQRQRAET